MPTNSKNKGAPGRLLGSFVQRFKTSWRALFGEKTVHKSFRVTRRRDALRPLALPGNIAFTSEVFRTIHKHWKILFGISFIYLVLYAVLVGIVSQDTYASMSESLHESAGELLQGAIGAFWQVALAFASIGSSGATEASTVEQQIFQVLLFAMLWLTVVWLVRNSLAGKAVRMRDGLYSSGAPLFATIVLILILFLQLIPVGLAVIGYVAATSSGLIAGGVESMLFWIAAGLLGLLSLYWIISSFFALIIVTIPGSYPLWALRTSSKLVAGRRVKLLLRIVWLVGVVVVTWITVLLFAVLIDGGLKQLIPALEWLPVVPFFLLLLTVWSALWSCVYIYLLYRKVVDNETE